MNDFFFSKEEEITSNTREKNKLKIFSAFVKMKGSTFGILQMYFSVCNESYKFLDCEILTFLRY